MSYKEAVLLVVVLFVFISFTVGAADPEREVLIRPGLVPLVDTVME